MSQMSEYEDDYANATCFREIWYRDPACVNQIY